MACKDHGVSQTAHKVFLGNSGDIWFLSFSSLNLAQGFWRPEDHRGI
jgi:hypothetical protein